MNAKMTSVCGRSLRSTRAFLAKLVSLLTIFVLLTPTFARAATMYSIDWTSIQYPDSSTYGTGYLASSYFSVNQTPLLTPTTPSAPPDSVGTRVTVLSNPFASILLTAGANTFHFGVTVTGENNVGVHQDEIVALSSSALTQSIPLFAFSRRDQAYTGTTTINLSLAQVNPPLAKDIAAVTTAIGGAETTLDNDASKVPNLAAQQQELANLQNDLAALANTPLDQISQAELDALLAKYADIVSPQVRAAVEQFVSDLRQSLADLQAQLTTLVQQFSQLATSVANLATQGAGGWNPDDPNNYGLTADPSSVPDIPAPDFSQTAGAFDAQNDPYKAYADTIVARLDALAQSGSIPAAQRPQFVSVVRGWRSNQLALQNAINTRVGVSQAETNAFLNAQNRVIAAIRQYMDQSDWFLQNPVSPSIRGFIDGVLNAEFGQLAADIKDGLNTWTETTPTADEALIAGTIGALGAGAADPKFDDFSDCDDRPATLQALSQAKSILRQYVFAISGPTGVFAQVCEAVWGREGCTSSGKMMSITDRVASGIGGLFGTASFWGELKSFASMAQTGDELSMVAVRLETLSLADRTTLKNTLGSKTIASFEHLSDEAFAIITNSVIKGESEILTSASTLSTDALNDIYVIHGGVPPFVPGTQAVTGVSKAFNHYVRFFSKAKGDLSGGRFLALASDVKGLTPAQIKDLLALEDLPDTVVDVALPAGEPIAVGVNAGVRDGNGWGQGRGFQVFWNKYISDWSKVMKYFTNERPIGSVFKG